METIKIGSRGSSVVKLQSILKVVADGIFGPVTDNAVRVFQKANGLAVDGIVGPKTWAALADEQPAVVRKSRRAINRIILHCADTVEDKSYTVDDIRQWHLARNFSDIGYHYVIYLDGSVHLGRDVDLTGAHCTGYNAGSIGICYIGGKKKDGSNGDTRTAAQKEAMDNLLKELKGLYPAATIHGHNEFANKLCPCFDVKSEYGNW